MTGQIYRLNDYAKQPSCIHRPNRQDCPVCRDPRPLAVVLSLRAARQAAEPVRPCDTEGDVA
jgi:hypothetical protein